jgi:hypothetical protein
MKYYLLCTQCGKKSEITEEEARTYALMRTATGGAARPASSVAAQSKVRLRVMSTL